VTDIQPRHVLGISGGKDSAALAIFLRDRVPEMEYFFCDTGHELPETYEYLVRLEAFLGKPIARLNSERAFDYWLKMYGDYLPSSNMRWCTRQLKLRPMEAWIGDSPAISYVAIRADEDREGYVSTKTNIKAVFPFREAGIAKDDVFRILADSGVGIPKYYEWRSRSGCYFCFFQRKAEWVGLKERHPDLFEKAKAFEKPGPNGEPGYSWVQGEPLTALEQPERVAEIKEKHTLAMERESKRKKSPRLMDVFENVLDDENDDQACLICTL
jgi:3'-phosphoadenosine 5'-phosphosulfate sulfotransferase (PAPS reductase)/FAD synthetase